MARSVDIGHLAQFIVVAGILKKKQTKKKVIRFGTFPIPSYPLFLFFVVFQGETGVGNTINPRKKKDLRSSKDHLHKGLWTKAKISYILY